MEIIEREDPDTAAPSSRPGICAQCGVKASKYEICNDCHRENVENYEKMGFIMAAGHTSHCANRQVWGDGECSCILREQK